MKGLIRHGVLVTKWAASRGCCICCNMVALCAAVLPCNMGDVELMREDCFFGEMQRKKCNMRCCAALTSLLCRNAAILVQPAAALAVRKRG